MSTWQTWNPEQYAEHARFVSDFGAPLIEMLAPKPGERVLDLGCGDGVLTKQVMDVGCEVVGVDASPEMIAAAQARGVYARVMDGHQLPYHEEFDAVFSNAALHWMDRPTDVIAGIWQALRPGGRFIAEFGGAGNVATALAGVQRTLQARGINPDAIQPWYFPSADEYWARLETQGFQVVSLDLFPRPTELPGDITNWLEMFAQPFLVAIPESQTATFLDEVRETLRPELATANGRWTVDYVRLRCVAFKPQDS